MSDSLFGVVPMAPKSSARLLRHVCDRCAWCHGRKTGEEGTTISG